MPIDGFEPDLAGLQAVFRAIPELVILLDLDGRIRYLNRTERYDRDDFMGVHAHELLPPASQEVFDAALDTVTETGELREYVVQAVLPDGEKAWYRTRMYPFPDAESMTAVLLTSIAPASGRAVWETKRRPTAARHRATGAWRPRDQVPGRRRVARRHR